MNIDDSSDAELRANAAALKDRLAFALRAATAELRSPVQEERLRAYLAQIEAEFAELVRALRGRAE